MANIPPLNLKGVKGEVLSTERFNTRPAQSNDGAIDFSIAGDATSASQAAQDKQARPVPRQPPRVTNSDTQLLDDIARKRANQRQAIPSRAIPMDEMPGHNERGPVATDFLSSNSGSAGSFDIGAPAAKAFAETNAAYSSLQLPSRFEFYQFKSLSARHITALEQSKFNRAHREKRTRYLVEAISSTLEPQRSAFDLTYHDFNWLMYWQRANSYSGLTFHHTSVCESPAHHRRVMDKEAEDRLEEKSLFTTSSVNLTTLDEVEFAWPEDATDLQLVQSERLKPPIMRDIVELEDLLEDLDGQITKIEVKNAQQAEDLRDKKSTYEYLGDLAVYIKPSFEAPTLIDRIELAKSLSPEAVTQIKKYAALVSNYGVTETIKVKCEVCGAEKEDVISLLALDFLPSV